MLRRRCGIVPDTQQADEESMQFCDITLNQWINIVLTVVIVFAVSAQAWFTRAQALLLKESEQRARDRDKPSVRIVPLTSHIKYSGPSGDTKFTTFQGFTVTNAGFIDVQITAFAFEIGRVISRGEDHFPTTEVVFPPVTQFEQATISTISLPHRLRYGESFSVLYDLAQLVAESARLGGETPVHMRPYCQDSLGNKHVPGHWTIYQDLSMFISVDGPSPGRISEEDWSQLSAEKQQRYSASSQRIVAG